MQIKNILSRLSDATHLGKSRDAADSIARKAVEASGASTPAASANKLREILAGYDMANISPKALSDLLKKLQQSGILPEKDLQELGQIRIDLDRDGISADQRVNLLDIYARKVQAAHQDAAELEQRLGSAGAQEFTGSLRRRLEWVEKFAAIHAAEGSTINTLA